MTKKNNSEEVYDNEKLNQTFREGTKKFTESDLEDVLNKESIARKKAVHLKGFFDEFILCFELLKDYKRGLYQAPWKLITAVGFAAVYLLMPFDVIPDFIPVLGFTDDAGILFLVLKTFQSEIEQYRQWKDNQIDSK